MFLDDSACNLASLNLVKFMRADGSFDAERFEAAVILYAVALDITVTMAQYPSARIAQQSFDFRPLGLGFANLGSLIMRRGIPYDSARARALGAAIASLTTAVCYRTSARLSEARTTEPSPRWPRHSGRKPKGSRTAVSLAGEAITRE